jgi:hypothetical protein
MNRPNNSSREKPENSAMTTVNVLGRLRMATEQVQKVKLSLAKDGACEIFLILYINDTQ